MLKCTDKFRKTKFILYFYHSLKNTDVCSNRKKRRRFNAIPIGTYVGLKRKVGMKAPFIRSMETCQQREKIIID